MYYRVSEFLENWYRQAETTGTLIRTIPEDAGKIVFGDGIRSLDRLAFHIPQGMVQIGIQAGLLRTAELPEDALPGSFAGIISLYMVQHRLLSEAVQVLWTDAMLTGPITMYGQQFRRGEALSLLEHHEMHHRSQLLLLMEMAGLEVPQTPGLISGKRVIPVLR